jgi:hypothetical protein
MDDRGVQTPPVTVELRLIPSSTAHGTVHVEGTARVDAGPPRPFSGWMALLQLLEGVVQDAQ